MARSVVVSRAGRSWPASGPPDVFRPTVASIPYRGVVCVLLEMDRPLSPYYWVNLAPPPGAVCVAMIEHTRFIPRSATAGVTSSTSPTTWTERPAWTAAWTRSSPPLEPFEGPEPRFRAVRQCLASRAGPLRPAGPLAGGPMPGLAIGRASRGCSTPAWPTSTRTIAEWRWPSLGPAGRRGGGRVVGGCGHERAARNIRRDGASSREAAADRVAGVAGGSGRRLARPRADRRPFSRPRRVRPDGGTDPRRGDAVSRSLGPRAAGLVSGQCRRPNGAAVAGSVARRLDCLAGICTDDRRPAFLSGLLRRRVSARTAWFWSAVFAVAVASYPTALGGGYTETFALPALVAALWMLDGTTPVPGRGRGHRSPARGRVPADRSVGSGCAGCRRSGRVRPRRCSELGAAAGGLRGGRRRSADFGAGLAGGGRRPW